MGKEELMKFANDPFWVRLRWFLFISFWVLWVAMLAGAIAIILMAPKCIAPNPRKWWEESPIVRLQFSDSPTKDLKGFQSLLDELKEQHIKAICLPSIMKGSLEGINKKNANRTNVTIDIRSKIYIEIFIYIYVITCDV